MEHWTGSVKEHMGGSSKPEKKIQHIEHRKSHNGDHVFTHHHTRPEHHPPEVHTKRGDDEMVEHMLEHAGTPNPGESEADAGNPEAYSPQAPAPMAGASPVSQVPPTGAQ